MKTLPINPRRVAILASHKPKAGERLIACSPVSVVLAADAKPDAPLPTDIVWMPKGDHEICASTMSGGTWSGLVRCDELGGSVVVAAFNECRGEGYRTWLDENHDDGAAVADVRVMRWDPALGIVATVEWTPLGQQLLRDRIYCSFSPAFWVDWESGRVAGIVERHALGGLVNAPAFGAAMPALIAARLSGAESTSTPRLTASGINAKDTNMKDLLIQILAALGVKVPDNATESQLTALVTEHAPKAQNAIVAATKVAELQTQLDAVKAQAGKPEDAVAIKAMKAELDALVISAKAQKKANAEKAVQAAVERGALKSEDTAIQAKWVGLIESDEKNVELLAAMPGKPTAQSVLIASDVTQRSTAEQAQILRVGIVDALKAYHAEKDHKKAAGIYASHISQVMRDPSFRVAHILASNSLGSLAGNLVVQKALTLLKLDFPVLSAFSTDFTDAGAKFNQTVVSRIRSVPTSSSFVAGTGYAQNDKTDTDVSVTLSNHKGISINLTANDLASTDRDLFGEQVEGVHQRVGLDLSAALFALILNANYANNTVQASSGFGRATLNTIAAALNDLGVPKIGRVAILNSTYFSALSGDASIVSYAAFQKPELLTEYMLPRVAGFQPYEANNLTDNSENLAGFCGTPDALVLTTRVPNDYTTALPGANNGSVSVVTNPDTGISVQLVQFVDHTKAQATSRVAYMYGVAKGQANSLRRILTA